MERSESSESLNSRDESITGFIPRDTYTPAPTSLPSAREAFTPPPRSGEDVEVDPFEHITAEELREHHNYVAAIIHAQRAAEQELGINPRHPA